MPDNKQICKTCKNRHILPIEEKCHNVSSVQADPEEVSNRLRDAAAASESHATNQVDPGGQKIQEILTQLTKMSQQFNMVEDQIIATS